MPASRFLPLAAALAAALAASAGPACARDSNFALVERGRYLTYAGDCQACHTADHGEPFAGGRAIPTPFGTIYSTNITPDPDTGIGKWSADDFWKAMHEGIDRDGKHLYPAFPYPWFTKLDRNDVFAIKAYLDTLEPVRQDTKKPEIPWPLSWRESVAGWNTIFFHKGHFQPDPGKSREWNRGAYLVQAAGHCGACHSPKNILGAVKKGERFEGGKGEGWYADDLTADKFEGLAGWSVAEIAKYLETGDNGRSRAYGPMKEVIENSTSHLLESDLRDIAIYLKDLPAGRGQGKRSPTTDRDVLARGRLLYIDQCSGCHMENGSGIPGVFPALKGDTAVHAHDPTSLARLVIDGATAASTPRNRNRFAMPAFGPKLSDADIADLLSYVRASWGNQAEPVEASKVADVRKNADKAS